jgi:hypothetical protein
MPLPMNQQKLFRQARTCAILSLEPLCYPVRSKTR